MFKDKEWQVPAKDLKLMLEAGYVYRYAGRYREARDIFQGVRALYPAREVGDLALAGISMDEGKLSEAEAYCRRALELNRSSAAAYVQLAEIQLRQNNSNGAGQSLQKSLEINPHGPSATLARTLLKLTPIVASRG